MAGLDPAICARTAWWPSLSFGEDEPVMARITLDIEATQVSAELARRAIPSNTRVHVEVDLVSASELPMSAIAQTGKGLDWLTDEPDFYSDADLVQRNRSTSIQE
jgi:hypothetical protein